MNFLPKNIFPSILVLSILLHLLLLSQFNWNLATEELQEKLIEVDLMEPEIIMRGPQKKRPALQSNKKQQVSTLKKIEDKPSPLEAKVTQKAEIVSPSSGIKDKISKVTVEKKEIPRPTFKPNFSLKSNLASGVIELKEPLTIGSDTIRKHELADDLAKGVGIEQVPSDKTPIAIDDRHLPPMHNVEKTVLSQPEKTGTGVQESGEVVNTFIEGEARTRKILFQPQPPELNIERDAEVTLHFTVLPDGSVASILPYTKADLELEQLAIDLLQQYRFEPLFGGDQKQSGIIHFIISRKR